MWQYPAQTAVLACLAVASADTVLQLQGSCPAEHVAHVLADQLRFGAHMPYSVCCAGFSCWGAVVQRLPWHIINGPGLGLGYVMSLGFASGVCLGFTSVV